MQHTPDNILIQKIRQGNKLAFDSLFFKYYKPLYRFAFNICNSKNIADESVQNTFVKLWKNYKNLKSDDEIAKLLFTYTRNEVIDEIRKLKTRKKYEESVSSETLVTEDQALNEKQKVKAIIESAIDQLPKKAKEIFRLTKQEGLSIKETAQYLKISTKTVENQLTIAYKKMRFYLGPFKNQFRF